MKEQDTTLKAGDFVTPTVQLVRPLAEGGMGRVWVARHTGLDTEVVVKLMSDEMTSRPDGAERFAREAAAAAAIKSPHVVQVFDHGVTEGGVPYIVMELLDGQDLAAHLAERGPMRPEEVVALVVQVGRALSKAHKAGIVHRDIKPDNIFLCDTRDTRLPESTPETSGPHAAVEEDVEVFVKLLDFGTAKRAESVSKTTVPGQIMGTPYYMSPEQSVGSELDERSDIWSLGVVVFEALTGKKPFDGASIGAIALAIHGVAPRLTAVVPGLPPAIDAWFEHCCAQKPEARFATAREASTAFVEAVTGLAPADQPTESVFFPPVIARSSKPPVAGAGERTPMQPVSRSMPPLRETLNEGGSRSRFTTVAAGLVMALAAVTMLAIVVHRTPSESAAQPVPSEIIPAKTTAPAAQPPASAAPVPMPDPTPEPAKAAAPTPKEPAKPALAPLPKDEPKPVASHAAPRETTAKKTTPPPAKGRHAKDGGAPAHEDDDLLKLQNVAPKTEPTPAPAPAPEPAPAPPPLPEFTDPK